MGGAFEWLRVAVGSVVVAAAAGAGLVVFGPQQAAPTVEAAAPTTSTTTTTVVEEPALTLSQPSAPPANPYEDVPIVRVGQITIPSIGVDLAFYEGVLETVINVGPGHWPGTAEAGGWGNTVIAAHRVTHGAPFRHIDDLAPGDEIVLRTSAGTFTYAVTGSRVVTPAEVSIADQRPGRTITLFACHPPGSARYRYVVVGKLIA